MSALTASTASTASTVPVDEVAEITLLKSTRPNTTTLMTEIARASHHMVVPLHTITTKRMAYSHF